MNRKHWLGIGMALLLGPWLYGQGFTVDRYTADVVINKEGYFTVSEHYDLTFQMLKHGIFRNIQLKYDLKNEQGAYEKRIIKISDVQVPGWKFTKSGKISRDLDGEVEIKIGDKHKTISGPQHYDISYRVDNAFLYETTATQFYWNLKPPNWYAPFSNMAFCIQPPEGVSVNPAALKVYTGPMGTSTESTDFTVTQENGVLVLTSKPGYSSNFGESITVLLPLPVDSVKVIPPPPWWKRKGWLFVILAIIGGFYATWRKYGKDDKVVAATSYYPPEGMDPAMAGYLIDDTANNVDLIALIPYWGAKGCIKVEEIDKPGWFAKDDIKLTKLKGLPSEASSYERKVFNGLFHGDEVLVSSLKDSFYKTMQSARTELKNAAQPYYEAQSRKVMHKTTLVLLGLMVVSFPIVLHLWNFWGAMATSGTCFVLLFFNIFMEKKNAKGNAALSQLKGFKKFVKLAEQKRLATLIKEDPRYFEDTMSYALAFGLFDKWAKKFEDLKVPPPSWYGSSTGRVYGMHSFSNSFSSAMASAQRTMVSSPSSSGSGGGGSSGGGFGGGGGGSW